MLCPFVSTPPLCMNWELLELGSGVFYLLGTANNHVPPTIVGPSSTPDCVAIQYELSSHSQLYNYYGLLTGPLHIPYRVC